MNTNYESMRQFVDSWGLLAMTLVFLVLVVWPLLPRSRRANEEASRMIFEDDDNGQ